MGLVWGPCRRPWFAGDREGDFEEDEVIRSPPRRWGSRIGGRSRARRAGAELAVVAPAEALGDAAGHTHGRIRRYPEFPCAPQAPVGGSNLLS
ncbi:hypothetical protein GCM10018952_17940 [Streptosporangium vulgare]